MTSVFWILFLIALGFAVVEMTVTFVLARRWQNYGIVDVVWSGGFALIALLGFLMSTVFGYLLPPLPNITPSVVVRWGLLTLMVILWSLRLALHLGIRVRSHHPAEDVRYAKLRAEWGSDAARRMFGFYQLQGALQAVLSAPFLLVYSDVGTGAGGIGVAEGAGLALWLAGLTGESIADLQLARFRADPAHRGRVCQVGLWNWSRHPNYFFEWLIWVGYAVFALGAPWGWLGMISPLLIGHFLINVTGIPMTEELSVKSKGDAYREYQRTTSAFVPWFKKTHR
jgi:steroid 5-alpha reductase family enzyme